MKEVLDTPTLLQNNIVIEYELPFAKNSRIDVVLFGTDENESDNIVVIELKQWSNNNVEDSEDDGNVVVNYGQFKKLNSHPSLQVEGYYWHLKDYMTIFEEEKPVLLSACVYCHNYSKGTDEVLYLQKFSKNLKEYPIFSKQETIELGNYLKEKLGKGRGLEVLKRFNLSIVRPSKKLLDHTGEMINKQQIFHLIEEQQTAYNTIMSQAKKVAKSKEKAVIIVKGGPGTGKSVIALEVMGELLRMGKNVVHATGSSAFTNTLRKILGVRSAKQFKFFNSFIGHKENEIDVLICDEAHRIRKTSGSRYTPRSSRTGEPQINELVRSAKLSVFFIDEHQIVRPNEIGNVNLIKESATKFNAKIYEMDELKTQFRCGGSAKYLELIEKILKIKDEGQDIELGDEQNMEFKIVDSPHELKKLIDQRNHENKNCARIVASYCWPWSEPNYDGTLVNDVKIEDFEMPWEKKDQFWKWATDDSGMKQVGTVYTAQGFEFDYIGVIFCNDLVWNEQKKDWEAKPENSYDTEAKRNNPNFVKHLKNVYRVLLTRAHKGVYVYFMNKETEKLFRSRIDGS
ncbi:hypothetical protein A3K63_03055 [Candidatus Micrarchaeota archaeon RBG_16_49_10]|nr:MAG: hypothetical protein A3K63_03055 [Candidatus Micrarchaeota archaeon RBG_16_49_10]